MQSKEPGCGTAKIIGVDLHTAALERAKEFGATPLIEASPEDTELREVMQRVRQLTEGRGAD
jgi:Zn-dependent alcohol dehydrogenase